MIVSRAPVRSRAAVVRKASAAEDQLAQAVARALNRTLADIPMERVRAVLAASTAAQAADAVAQLSALAPGLSELREAAEGALGSAQARAAVQEAGRLGFSYQVSPQRALIWARAQAADLVVGVGQSTRAAIRATVVNALEQGQGIPEAAKAIRQVVGLHPAWAAAVRRVHAESLAGGATPEIADRVAQRARSRLIRRRSENIARTEIMRAVNEGSHAAWSTAAALGLWGDGEPEREWLTASDERTCPICRPLNGVRVSGLDSSFPGGVVMPPRHPSCRCRVIVVNSLAAPTAPTKVTAGQRRQIRDLRDQVRDRAAEVRADAAGTLDVLDAARISPPPKKVRTTNALGQVVYRRPGVGGEWDWFDQLNPVEQLRVSRNWFSADFGTQGPDQIAQQFINHGAASDWQEAMDKWLDLTRRHDAALAIRRGKLPSERVFGDFDLDGTFGDGTYRVRDVFNHDITEAAQAIAQSDAEAAQDFAWRALQRAPGHTDLPAPWEMDLEDYVDELTGLEDLARVAQPTGGDAEFGFTYSGGDQFTFRRLQELAPQDLDAVGEDRLSAADLWAVIREQAKLAGLR